MMNKELEEFRKDIDKIKDFCVLVAAEHKHIPSLNRAWHNGDENLITDAIIHGMRIWIISPGQ